MRNFYIFLLLFIIGYSYQGLAQDSNKPKLVVGVIIDQMGFDQLYKYHDRYGETGFKRLIRDGFNFKNANVNYIPSETAPGHASIYTGTTPAYHGIIGNSWYDRDLGNYVGNVIDSNEKIVGSINENPNGTSPKNLAATTITDELRLRSKFKSKVISVSIKDRAAILPGGKSANAAYWFDWESSPGYFVSSSFYMKKVPKWVSKFNELGKSNIYLNHSWNTLYPLSTYTASSPDNNKYEPSLGGKSSPTFPYDFKTMREKYVKSGLEYQLLLVSPGGNSLLTEFAIAAIENEELGMDEYPDILNVSYSITDVIGHTFGPQSVEMEDIYLRLDKNLGELFATLDSKVGKDDYLLFLTSDHAAIPVVSYLRDNKLDGDIARIVEYNNQLKSFLEAKYGAGSWIDNFDGDQVYLNKNTVDEKKLVLPVIQQEVADFLMTQKGVYLALTAHELQTKTYEEGLRKTIQNGYHPKRSGDVLISYNSGTILNPDPQMVVERVKGTVHGSGYSYDTHVPLLWMGSGIPKGESVRSVNPIDITPSLAMFLNLQLPSAVQGKPLSELFD
ncbi:alkaline phosphatase PafA [Maribacter arenosus]|uniref:Alkaline phosphatase family protein n=1 Tax=Maribacter arenosus TaxID=1854708 RepID=A0ABR7VGU0_9FLAO|nr:alkaline phosphatase PafA [Maribacter arenosus]MBD0851372.1 alkaline phosphatase family protein [Maribacter arenosus]